MPATRFGPGHKFKTARAAFSVNVPAPRHQFLSAYTAVRPILALQFHIGWMLCTRRAGTCNGVTR